MYYRNVQEVIDYLKKRHDKFEEIQQQYKAVRDNELIKVRKEEILAILEEISK